MSQTRNTLTLAIRLNALLRYSRRMLAIGLVALLFVREREGIATAERLQERVEVL